MVVLGVRMNIVIMIDSMSKTNININKADESIILSAWHCLVSNEYE